MAAVLLESSFEACTPEQKRAVHASLQDCAARAGLRGSVVAVWRDASGRTRFLAPPEQHAFFQIVSYSQLAAQINRTMECAPIRGVHSRTSIRAVDSGLTPHQPDDRLPTA